MAALPRFIVLGRPNGIYLQFVQEGLNRRRLQLTSPAAVSQQHFTKLEVVRAQTDRNLIHIRSCYNNKYLVLESDDSQFFVAAADEPEEDRSKWSCTLLRPTVGANGLSLFLQSRGRQHSVQLFSQPDNWLGIERNSAASYWFQVTNMSSLAILPRHVAFKGDNNLYLSSRYIRTQNRLQYASNNLLDREVHHECITLSDGNVCFRSQHFNRFWRKSNPEWIFPDVSDMNSNNSDLVFRPVKLDSQGNTIALLNLGNNKYCMRWIRGGQPRLVNTLTASASAVDSDLAVMRLEEAIREREIYDIRYNIEDARISNVVPYPEGSLPRITYNTIQETVVKTVKLVWTKETQETFNSSHSWKLSYATQMNVTVIPKLVQGKISLDASYNGSVEWSKTVEESVTHITELKIPVPPMTKSEVILIVGRGSIDVPFSYMQHDILASGEHVTHHMNDGLFTGLDTQVITHTIKEESLSGLSESELEAIREAEEKEAAAARSSRL